MAHGLLLLQHMMFGLKVSKRVEMVLIVPHQGYLMAV